jgi:hypothetical protein
MTWISVDDDWPSSDASVRPGTDLPRLVVPAYFHPADHLRQWEELAAHPSQVRLVILNLANGPGTGPNTDFEPALELLRSAGIAVAGYVDTNYGARSGRAALADLHRYLRWFDVTGVFFDRAASSAQLLGYYAELARRSRELGAQTVVFNHGTHPLEAYAEHADLLGTFEGPWQAYLQLGIPRWTRSRPADTFYHVVYSVPAAHAADAFLLAVRRRAGCVYVTDDGGGNPYDRLPAWGLAREAPWTGP